MEELILTQLSVNELKSLIKDCLREVLKEGDHFGKTHSNDKPMSLKEVCEYVNLSPATIYKLTSCNEIPFSKRSKRLYFNQEEIKAWIREGRRKTHKEIEEEARGYLLKKGMYK